MYLKYPLLLLAFSANVSVFRYAGYSSSFFLSIIVLFLYVLRVAIIGKIDRVTIIAFVVGVLVVSVGLIWGEVISAIRVFLATLIIAFVISLSKLRISEIDLFASSYFQISKILLFVSFSIFLASIFGAISLDRFVSFGGRFAGFSFENVEHVIACFTLLLLFLSSSGNHFGKRNLPIMPFLLLVFILLAQSNMIFIIFLSFFQALIVKFFRFRHQSFLFIAGLIVSMLLLQEILYIILPSVRGGESDVVERFRGAEQLLGILFENARFFSLEFFQLERACIMQTETNNFGFLNLYCDFGLFGLFVLFSIFFILERYLSCRTKEGFYLSLLTIFSMNAILIVPYYYSPTILFALVYGVRKLNQINRQRLPTVND